MRAPLEERFWAKVEKTPTCWLWTGAVNDAGYGIIGLGTREQGTARAHRVSYEMHIGPLPDGLFVCHRCDVRLCVRPEHLFAGTQADNVRDMWSKGRESPPPRLTGIQNARARVVELDGRSLTLSDWSKLTGIRSGTIKARLNRGWSASRAVKEQT